jgi:DNA-binding CsgD family transcriptional regulator
VHLSPRETEILRYIAAGHTTKDVAAALNIAESTVEWHISNVLVKLGAASRAEAVAIGLREGLLEPGERPLSVTSATDSAARRARRARASRESEVVDFDVLGLHLGKISIGKPERSWADEKQSPSVRSRASPGPKARGLLTRRADRSCVLH